MTSFGDGVKSSELIFFLGNYYASWDFLKLSFKDRLHSVWWDIQVKFSLSILFYVF